MQIVEEGNDNEGKRQKRWVDRDRKEMISQITEKGLDDLVDKFNAEEYQYWNMWYNSTGLNKDGYDKTEAFQQMMKKVENLITSQNPKNVVS